MEYLFNFFFAIASTVLFYFGYRLFKYGAESQNENSGNGMNARRAFYSGTGPGLLFMVFSGLMLIFLLFSIGKNNTYRQFPTNRQQLNRLNDEAVFDYIIQNHNEIQTMKEQFEKSNKILDKLSASITTYETQRSRQMEWFRDEINNSREIIADLNENVLSLNAVRDSLLSRKDAYSRWDTYFKSQEVVLAKAIKMLGIINNRQNLIERAVVKLHAKELQEKGVPLGETDFSKILSDERR